MLNHFYFLASCQISFTSKDVRVRMAGSFGIASGDFNNDNQADHVITYQTNDIASILLGNANGIFVEQTPILLGSSPQMIVVSDCFDESWFRSS